MYAKLFEKLGLKTERLSYYAGVNLQAFNETLTYPYGYIYIMVTLVERRKTRTINLYLLVFSGKSLYNCIMGRAFATTLDTVVSLVHIKMKYHNIHDKHLKIYSNLYESWWIHKFLYYKYDVTLIENGKQITLEVIMAYLNKCLRKMVGSHQNEELASPIGTT